MATGPLPPRNTAYSDVWRRLMRLPRDDQLRFVGEAVEYVGAPPGIDTEAARTVRRQSECLDAMRRVVSSREIDPRDISPNLFEDGCRALNIPLDRNSVRAAFGSWRAGKRLLVEGEAAESPQQVAIRKRNATPRHRATEEPLVSLSSWLDTLPCSDDQDVYAVWACAANQLNPDSPRHLMPAGIENSLALGWAQAVRLARGEYAANDDAERLKGERIHACGEELVTMRGAAYLLQRTVSGTDAVFARLDPAVRPAGKIGGVFLYRRQDIECVRARRPLLDEQARDLVVAAPAVADLLGIHIRTLYKRRSRRSPDVPPESGSLYGKPWWEVTALEAWFSGRRRGVKSSR